jgi:hypothetical protein
MAPRRTKKAEVPTLPQSHLIKIDRLGMRTVAYLSTFVATAAGRNEWLPRDIIGNDGKSLVIYREGGDYHFAGWEPWRDGHFGGRYETILGALAWFDWLEAENKESF